MPISTFIEVFDITVIIQYCEIRPKREGPLKVRRWNQHRLIEDSASR